MTSHTPKSLRPFMNSKDISGILDGYWNTHAEIALNRYEPNIDNIKEGSNGGRIAPEYIYESKGDNGIKYAKEFGVPIIEFLYTSPEKYKELENLSKKSLLEEREPRRVRKTGDIVLEARRVLEKNLEKEKNWEVFLQSIDEQVNEMPDSAERKKEATRNIRVILAKNKAKDTERDSR